MAKRKKTKHKPLSRQVEDAFLAGLAKLGVTKQQLSREHQALKQTLKKVDAAAGRAVKSVGDEVSQLSSSVRKTAASAKKRVTGKKTAKKKTKKKGAKPKATPRKPAAKKKITKKKR